MLSFETFVVHFIALYIYIHITHPLYNDVFVHFLPLVHRCFLCMVAKYLQLVFILDNIWLSEALFFFHSFFIYQQLFIMNDDHK